MKNEFHKFVKFLCFDNFRESDNEYSWAQFFYKKGISFKYFLGVWDEVQDIVGCECDFETRMSKINEILSKSHYEPAYLFDTKISALL